jgi:SNF2 family DNA or RNA helicase
VAAIVKAHVDRLSGWVSLRFPYDLQTVALLKNYPGSKWDPKLKQWRVPIDLWEAVLQYVMKHEVGIVQERRAPVHETIARRLRPYQQAATEFLIRHRGALLTFQMRVGKTPTAIAAATALMGTGQAKKMVVVYPAGVVGEWERQLKQWANLPLRALESFDLLPQNTRDALARTPYLALGCHYEILDKRVTKKDENETIWGDIEEIIAGDPFILIADEIHSCKNRKAGRTKALHKLSGLPNCVARWGLSGTEMRNSPRDLWALWEFLNPGSGGGYWTFAKRYCNAFINDMGFWDDKGESNEEELSARLKVISMKKLRSDPDVAPHLPKADRKVIQCLAPPAMQKKYDAMEKALATKVGAGLSDGDGVNAASREAVKALTLMVSEAKIPTAIKRAKQHIENGLRFTVFAHFHETLEAFIEAGEKAGLPLYVATGWVPVMKRNEKIAEWKKATEPGILVLSTLASGMGIDLSDAALSMFLEFEWVPADFRQAEDRQVDVHQGKRTAPPVFEYLFVKGTIDEAMGAALLRKIRSNQKITGGDSEMHGVSSALREAGVVGASRLGLENTDRATVAAAIQSAVTRWLNEDTSTGSPPAAISFDDWDDPDEVPDGESAA